MKKILILAAASLTLFSCTKDRTCSCDVLGSIQTETYTDISKSDAQDKCDAFEVGIDLGDLTVCTLD